MFKQLSVEFILYIRHMSMTRTHEYESDIHPNPLKKLVKINKRKHFQAPESQRKRTGLFLLVKQRVVNEK